MHLKRLLYLMTLLVLLPTAAAAQERIDLQLQKVSVQEAIVAVTQRWNYSIILHPGEVDMGKIVTVSAEQADIRDVLAQIFAGQDVEYEIEGKRIFVGRPKARKPVSEAASGTSFGRYTVSGTIRDDTGEPLAGASAVVVSGGRLVGTVAGSDGRFEIQLAAAPEPGSTITFSFLGFMEQTLPLGERSRFEMTLYPDREQLSESVVVGYGTQKKVNLTGAVSVVDGAAVESRSASSLARLIQGTMPNVTITTGTGRPGLASTLNIRGVNTISSTTGPLILIDGVESDIDHLNPNDVESISVLKDASAAAVYGARAGFGVMLITTKLPREESSTVRYSGKFGFGGITTSTDFETRGYYNAYINDMFYRVYQGLNYTTYTEEDYHELWIRRNDRTEHPDRPWVVEKDGQYKYYGNFDWYNYLYDNTRPTWEHNISLSGGSRTVKYFVSGNFYSQKGAMRRNPDRYRRYTVRSKVSADIKPWLTVSNNSAFYHSSYSFPGTNATASYTNAVNHALPAIVPINPDGTLVYASSTSAGGYRAANGWGAILTYGKHRNEDINREFRTAFDAIFKPTEHFSITASYSYVRYDLHDQNRAVDVPISDTPGVITYIPSSVTYNHLTEYFNSTDLHTANIYGSWQRTLAGGHALSTMAGANYETKFYKNNSFSRDNLQSDDLDDFRLATGTNYTISGSKARYRLLGIFYRANYNYMERYLVEASGRYDGSSRFGRGQRFGFFPSFSAGWRVSEEPFFAGARETVNNLKLRFSYGSLGNQAGVNEYATIQTMTTGALNYIFGDSKKASYATESAPNAGDMTWETIVTTNAGLDLGLFKGRFNLTADAYLRQTRDMLMAGMQLPGVYGASEPQMNAANMNTWGWELSLSWNDRFRLLGSPFNYGASFGIGDNVTYVTKFENPNKTLGTPYAGMRLGDIWGYRIDGLFISDGEAAAWPVDQSYVNSMINTQVIDTGLHAGDMKFRDLDGSGKIEPTTSANDLKDTEIIGNSLPRYNYSFSVHADWKGFDLSVMFQGVGRQNWYPGHESLFWGPYGRPYQSFIPSDFMKDVWSEDNPDAYYPRPRGYVAWNGSDGGVRELYACNDRYLQNIGYCRLKNVTFGWTLPKKWAAAAKMDKARVYFTGENLATFTSLRSRYVDPEQAAATLSWSNFRSAAVNYPFAKTYTFGLDITF